MSEYVRICLHVHMRKGPPNVLAYHCGIQLLLQCKTVDQ